MSIIERERVIETSPPQPSPPETVKPTKRDVFQRAADLIEEFGWRQHSRGSKAEGSMCLTGAVAEAARDLGEDPDIWHRRCYDTREFDYLPQTWNDEPWRTKAEVIAVLRKAADRA